MTQAHSTASTIHPNTSKPRACPFHRFVASIAAQASCRETWNGFAREHWALTMLNGTTPDRQSSTALTACQRRPRSIKQVVVQACARALERVGVNGTEGGSPPALRWQRSMRMAPGCRGEKRSRQQGLQRGWGEGGREEGREGGYRTPSPHSLSLLIPPPNFLSFSLFLSLSLSFSLSSLLSLLSPPLPSPLSLSPPILLFLSLSQPDSTVSCRHGRHIHAREGSGREEGGGGGRTFTRAMAAGGVGTCMCSP